MEKIPESNYDRFFFEEFCKKIKKNEDLEQFYSTLKSLEAGADYKAELEILINEVLGVSDKNVNNK